MSQKIVALLFECLFLAKLFLFWLPITIYWTPPPNHQLSFIVQLNLISTVLLKVKMIAQKHRTLCVSECSLHDEECQNSYDKKHKSFVVCGPKTSTKFTLKSFDFVVARTFLYRSLILRAWVIATFWGNKGLDKLVSWPLKHIRSKTSNNSTRCKRRSPPNPWRLCMWESYGKSYTTAKLNKVNQLTRLGLSCLLRAVCTYRPLLFFTTPKTEVY